MCAADDSSKTEEAAKDGEKDVKKEGEAEKNSKEPGKTENEVKSCSSGAVRKSPVGSVVRRGFSSR